MDSVQKTGVFLKPSREMIIKPTNIAELLIYFHQHNWAILTDCLLINEGKQGNAISFKAEVLMPKSICVQNVIPNKPSLGDILK